MQNQNYITYISFLYTVILICKLKLILIIKKVSLLYLASCASCYQIIVILSKPIASKLEILFYLHKITIMALICG